MAASHLVTIAGIVAVVLISVLIVFQIALAFGAPWGAAAWGGRYAGRLPTNLRVASLLVAGTIYPLIGLAILEATDLAAIDWFPDFGTVPMWALAGFFALGTLANFASRSKVERYWGPVALALAICCALIAGSI